MPEVIASIDMDVRLYAKTKKGYLLKSRISDLEVNLDSQGLPQNMGFRKLNHIQESLIEWAKEVIEGLEVR